MSSSDVVWEIRKQGKSRYKPLTRSQCEAIEADFQKYSREKTVAKAVNESRQIRTVSNEKMHLNISPPPSCNCSIHNFSGTPYACFLSDPRGRKLNFHVWWLHVSCNCIIVWSIGCHLGLGAHWHCAGLIKPSSGHRTFVLSWLLLCHGLVLLDSPEEILIRDSICRINLGLHQSLILSQVVHFSRSHWPLQDSRKITDINWWLLLPKCHRF